MAKIEGALVGTWVGKISYTERCSMSGQGADVFVQDGTWEDDQYARIAGGGIEGGLTNLVTEKTVRLTIQVCESQLTITRAIYMSLESYQSTVSKVNSIYMQVGGRCWWRGS